MRGVGLIVSSGVPKCSENFVQLRLKSLRNIKLKAGYYCRIVRAAGKKKSKILLVQKA